MLAVLAVGLAVWPGHLFRAGGSSPGGRVAAARSFAPGQPIPDGAADAARRLVAGSVLEQHAVLAPALAATLPEGALFPTGSTLALDANSWRRSGDYANARGTLSEPGKAPAHAVIGFVADARHTGGWLVTFEEQLP
jgi:hypothetical protein